MGRLVHRLRSFLFDVLLPVVDKILDGLLIYHYYTNEKYVWMGTTIGAVALPGFLEMVYWLMHCRSENSRRILAWILFFGPFTFPISIILWHLYNVVMGKVRENRSMSVVLTSLQAQTESAIQLVLQTRIMMITWTTFEVNWLQLASVISSLFMLSKVSKDHHYYELSGKNKLPRNLKTLFPHFVFLLITASRTFVIALCIAYARFWSMVPLAIYLAFNGMTASLTLKTDRGKNIWTTFTSIMGPTCYVARAHVSNLPNPPKRFYIFYVLNSLWFLILAVGVAFALFFGLNNQLPGLSGYGCDYTPFLSCFPKEFECVSNRVEICMPDQNPHQGFQTYGITSVAALSLLQFVMTFFLHDTCTRVSTSSMIEV